MSQCLAHLLLHCGDSESLPEPRQQKRVLCRQPNNPGGITPINTRANLRAASAVELLVTPIGAQCVIRSWRTRRRSWMMLSESA